MNDKFCGIILSAMDYKDSDVLFKVLSREYGLLSLIGKSSKKIAGKNHFLPMCEYEFIIDYKDNKTIFSIHGSKLLNNYYEDSDLEMMTYKNIFLQAASKEREGVEILYDDLIFLLSRINRENMYCLGALFFSEMLKEYGITPEVDGCVICGKEKVVSLSKRQGGFLCIDHLKGEEPMDVLRLKKFRLAVKGSFEYFDVISKFDYDFADFSLLADFFVENSDIRLQSYELFKTICLG